MLNVSGNDMVATAYYNNIDESGVAGQLVVNDMVIKFKGKKQLRPVLKFFFNF